MSVATTEVYRRKRPDETGKQLNMKQRRDEMDVIDERALVYMAVLFVCSAVAVSLGRLEQRRPSASSRRPWRVLIGWVEA